MFLANLEVEDFRNWQAVELAFPQRVTLIEGGNAQGKTNLLEAIYILLTLHSFRSRRHEEMIRFGAGGFFLRGTLGGDGRPPRQVVIAVEPGRRTAMLDGKRTSRSPAPAVVFSPEDLALVEDGADLRRRYLDRMAALEAPAHDDDVVRAHRVLQQRNRLLALRDGSASPPGTRSWSRSTPASWCVADGRPTGSPGTSGRRTGPWRTARRRQRSTDRQRRSPRRWTPRWRRRSATPWPPPGTASWRRG